MSPSIFREKGYRFYFLSNEESRIHIHVTCENGEAKFWLEPIVALATYHKLNSKRLGEIQNIIVEHKDEIIQAWNKHFGNR
jgi:hypothetical protein